jgi:hypothetical protein
MSENAHGALLFLCAPLRARKLAARTRLCREIRLSTCQR